MAEPIGESMTTYIFRDINQALVTAWEEIFRDYTESGKIQISQGDIFKGAPSADAIVSPANSFGFMDGGIDMAYSQHFGWQMQERLQEVIRSEYDGELLVGQAAVIPAMPEDKQAKDMSLDWAGCNENQPIRWLVSAPTMRVPHFVNRTVNAYLAFRAIILAVKKHNASHEDKIRTVLCPGLGTAVGAMNKKQCAIQMLEAYRVFELNEKPEVKAPLGLSDSSHHHFDMMLNQSNENTFNEWCAIL